MNQKALIYERDRKLFVQTSSQAEEGFWITEGECRTLPADAPPEKIGTAVQEAVAASRAGVPAPARLVDVAKPLLAASGAKSFNAFAKRARLVEVDRDRDLTLRATQNRGKEGGFVPIPGREIVLPASASPEQLGRAIHEAMARCE